jgi:hypothetical protein
MTGADDEDSVGGSSSRAPSPTTTFHPGAALPPLLPQQPTPSALPPREAHLERPKLHRASSTMSTFSSLSVATRRRRHVAANKVPQQYSRIGRHTHAPVEYWEFDMNRLTSRTADGDSSRPRVARTTSGAPLEASFSSSSPLSPTPPPRMPTGGGGGGGGGHALRVGELPQFLRAQLAASEVREAPSRPCPPAQCRLSLHGASVAGPHSLCRSPRTVRAAHYILARPHDRPRPAPCTQAELDEQEVAFGALTAAEQLERRKARRRPRTRTCRWCAPPRPVPPRLRAISTHARRHRDCQGCRN